MYERPDLLSAEETEARLVQLPGWSVEDGRLTRSYTFDQHLQAAAMVIHVAQIQQELDHHSDLTLGYHSLVLAVNTHSVGGLTELDFRLAHRVETIAPGHGAR
ncbi:4a-hydroxytetrahydrobiopterin dehydratase [Streptomyces sp. NPDC059740]|uniref:4a-hydroxytetrahydrobiopterin dehydratase n=1 Tax=Streptomyces sp. NPDC059740 TaxID=3346926 RepID=UPI0036659703